MSTGEKRLDHLRGLADAEPLAADDGSGVGARLSRICRVAARSLPAAGAGITIMDRRNRPVGPIAASSRRFRRLEELQFTLGEGPCVDAYASRRPVLEHNLRKNGMCRWPGYAVAVQEQGVAAVFAFPLQVGAARLGVLDVYREDPVELSPPALADALGFASLCLTTLLDGDSVGSDGHLGNDLDDAFRSGLEVYQAQGAVMIQLGVSLDEALARLRAHAYALNRPIGEVALAILAGTMVFSREDL